MTMRAGSSRSFFKLYLISACVEAPPEIQARLGLSLHGPGVEADASGVHGAVELNLLVPGSLHHLHSLGVGAKWNG